MVVAIMVVVQSVSLVRVCVVSTNIILTNTAGSRLILFRSWIGRMFVVVAIMVGVSCVARFHSIRRSALLVL